MTTSLSKNNQSLDKEVNARTYLLKSQAQGLLFLLKLAIPGYIPYHIHKEIKKHAQMDDRSLTDVKTLLYTAAGALEGTKLVLEYYYIARPLYESLKSLF